MDIQLTEEQELLRSSVQKVLKDEYGFDVRRKIIASEDGWSHPVWRTFAEMGLLAAPFAESHGGFGDGPLTTMIVMQEFGRNLVVEPYFETVILAGGLIEAEGREDQRQAYLSAIAAGEAVWALAFAESGSRYDLGNVATTARKFGDHFVLSGMKSTVIGAPWADKLIVSARIAGDRTDKDGVSLFIVDRRSGGVDLQSYKTIDGRRAAEITLTNVRVPVSDCLGVEGQGTGMLERLRDRAIGALCAEAVGAMTELNTVTVDYAKTRKQFGVAIGTFQVLQHRMVDMFIAREEAISLTQHLTLNLAAGDGHVSKLASGTKAKVGYAARFVGEQAIQLHGGMGMSDEFHVGHYFKRIGAIDIQFGDPAFHLMQFARAT
jgi:alkylation response protein AidB-like acyl-CoA dehydrogenase